MAFEQQSHLTAERRLQYRSRLVAVLALAPIVALPFLCNLGVTFSWSYLKLFALQTAVLVACAGLFIVRPAGAARMLGASGVGLPMVFVLLWGAMSTMWSNVPWAAVQPLVELGYMALAVVAFANLLTSPATRKWFTAVYGASAGAACVVYVLCNGAAESHMRVYPFENPNVGAAFAIIPLAVGVAYAVSAAARRVPILAGVLGLLVAGACGSAIVTSNSAAAMVSAAGAVFLVVAFSLRGMVRRMLLELSCLGAILLALWPLLAPDLWPGEWLDRQLGARPAMWQGAVRLIRKSPVRGLGLGSFMVEYTRVFPLDYAAHRYTSDIVENAHCLPLHVLAELGVIGAMFGAWLLIRIFLNARLAARDAGPGDRTLLLGLVCGGLGMLAQGLASTSLHQPECTINLVLALAVIGGVAAARRPHAAVGRPALWSRIIPPVLLAGIYVATAGGGLLSQIYLRRASVAPAERTTLRRDDLRRSIAATWPTLWTIKARLKLALLYQNNGYKRAALAEIRAIDRLAPNFAAISRHEADLLLQLDRPEDAARAILRYCRKNPFSRDAYRIWAAILERAMQAGKPQAARPDEAVKLLAIAEERIQADIFRIWYKQLELGKGAGKALGPKEGAELLAEIRETHVVGTLKLDNARAFKRIFLKACQPAPVRPD